MLIQKAKHFRGTPTSSRALFFDRDGVINEAIEAKDFRGPRSISETVVKDGIEAALELSKRANFLNFIVTNQPDVSRGYLSLEKLQGIHEFLIVNLPCVDAIITCIHDSFEECVCRKPSDGMLRAAALEFNIDLPRSFMIGDRWVDIEAGRRAGVKTILVDTEYSWRPTSAGAAPEKLIPDFIVSGIYQLEELLSQIFIESKD